MAETGIKEHRMFLKNISADYIALRALKDKGHGLAVFRMDGKAKLVGYSSDPSKKIKGI